MTFGEKLQKLRAKEGLSQDGLAELLDVSRQAVSRWERDETMPETEKIVRLSSYFHVTTDYLLKDEEEPSPAPPQSPAPAAPAGSWFQRNRKLVGGVLIAIGGWRVMLMVPALATIFHTMSITRALEKIPGVTHAGSSASSLTLPMFGAVIFLLMWLTVIAVGMWLLLGKGKKR